MPNIPRVPGVPALTSYSANSISLLLRDLVPLAIGLFGGPQWGIFLFGIPILPLNSVVTFDYRQDYDLSDYPVEQGGFQSYNKVGNPSNIRCRVACGGSVVDRQAFLTLLDAAVASLQLYDVVTPEKVFLNYNFSHMDFRRAAENVGLLVVDIWLTEVRETAQATFTQTQEPQIEGRQALGNVQSQSPVSQITQRFSAGNWRLF